MARILVGTSPASGHIRPGLPIARELVARRHDVVWYTSDRFKASVERTGARHVGFTAAVDIDESDLDSSFPGRSKVKSGIPQLKFDLQSIFVDTIPDYLTDLRDVAERHVPDMIVVESAFLAAALLAEERDLAWIVYGTTPLTARSVDCAPLGFGLPPMAGPLGRLRNVVLNALVERVFARPHKRYQQVRLQLGFARALRESRRACRRLSCSGTQGDDASPHVLVDTCEWSGLNRQPGLLVDLSDQTFLDGLVKLEHAAWWLPLAVVGPSDGENTPCVVDDCSRDTY